MGKRGMSYRKSATSGSHAHHGERTGAGPVAGAGEVKSGGPGMMATRVKPQASDKGIAQGYGTSNYKPKGMDVYKEGS